MAVKAVVIERIPKKRSGFRRKMRVKTNWQSGFDDSV
ncbi:hypothetical protein Q644_02930 [Brucella intermedia 229E]|uniref:Uncharacterized protein n=1 Tax=Brucella intermedia 229E TaxID=1337887 RepID=U4VFZ5_9HYPH|nr:hypothetical protein Q644_02930 [Brucella intermedia 229E]